MPDAGFPASSAARGGRRPMPRRMRPVERPEPQDEAGGDGAARQGGPWPLWSTALPERASAQVATGPVHGTASVADAALTTTLFRTWINGPCKTVYCCAVEGVPADGVLTLAPADKDTAKAVEALAHDVMASSGGPGSQQPEFSIHALPADPAAVRQDVLDAVADAPWSSGICFLYDPGAVERSVVLAGLGLVPPAPTVVPPATPDQGD